MSEDTEKAVDAVSMAERILSLGAMLREKDENSYLEVVIQLATILPSEAKQKLYDALRNPMDAVGILKDDPMWVQVEAAMERNRRRDAEEYAAEMQKEETLYRSN